jgi:hypothetical protein
MKVRLRILREYIREQAWMPGRWLPSDGEPVSGPESERLDPGVSESDARIEGDDRGPGGNPDDDVAEHLVDDEEGRGLGDPVAESLGLELEFLDFFLQEGPAGASGSDPRDAKGAYAPFDMVRDHTGTDDISATWYRSPGREAGTSGDPYRGEDPNAQIGMHPKDTDPTTTPPAAAGTGGIAARRAPAIWQLSAGSDTSKVLGADAKPSSGGDDHEEEGSDTDDHEEKQEKSGAEPDEGDEAPGQGKDKAGRTDRGDRQ